jgi:polyferredoxin
MEQSQNPKPYRRQLLLRLVRIALMALSLLLLSVFLLPAQFLPPDMTLGEFLQALLGVLMLSGVMAAVVFRAWHDYQRKRREKNGSRQADSHR